MYAELHALSNFSFLRGASHGEELVNQAKALGYRALAITDECSLAGVVRAHIAAKESGLPLIIGTELNLNDGLKLVALATDRISYGNLSRLISKARRASAKGSYALAREDLEGELNGVQGCHGCGRGNTGPPTAGTIRRPLAGTQTLIHRSRVDRCGIAHRRRRCAPPAVAASLRRRTLQLPCVACGDVHMHKRSRRALQDVLTAIRVGTPLKESGFALYPNGERHLRPLKAPAPLYPATLLAETLAIATVGMQPDSLSSVPTRMAVSTSCSARQLRLCMDIATRTQNSCKVSPKACSHCRRRASRSCYRSTCDPVNHSFVASAARIIAFAAPCQPDSRSVPSRSSRAGALPLALARQPPVKIYLARSIEWPRHIPASIRHLNSAPATI